MAAVLAAVAVALAGCGFKPLYGRNSGGGEVVPEFSQIYIEQPEDRTAQQLRNALLDLLTPRGTPERPRYLLTYTINESVGSVFITRSEEITRSNLHLSASFTLRDYQTGKRIYSGSAASQASFNQTVADYANLIAEKNARERALREVAEQMRIRLANHFDYWRTLPPRQAEELRPLRQ